MGTRAAVRAALTLSTLALVLAVWGVLVQGAPAPAGTPAQIPAAEQPEGAAEPVGDQTCLVCHADARTGYEDSLHARPSIPGSPAALQGCESCHGLGSRHVGAPFDDTLIRKPAVMAARDVSELCLSCHTSAEHVLWDGSAHDARNLSCATCHSVHAPQSPTAQLVAPDEVTLCESCHRVETLKLERVSHMPVAVGQMTCSSCHTPHGSANVRLLREGMWINESCVSCHAEKRGPFLFEHAAGRESCVSCHDPHGSTNDRMLVARLPMLCQRCHIGTRHPSTIFDAGAVADLDPRIVGRSCVNCHSQIHGSNHPSGQALTR